MSHEARYLVRTPAAALLVCLLLGGCRPRSLEGYARRLPELPAEVAATLDGDTLATRHALDFTAPQEVPAPGAAPCCASTETRRLRVEYAYTKCGSPAEVLGVDLSDLVLARRAPGGGERPQRHKLTALAGTPLPRVNLCVSSRGPWDAVLTETRACSPYTPVYSLVISAFGDAVVFNWSGANHPTNVTIVECRTLGVTRTPCGISECTCLSEPCTSDAACQCGLDWP